MTLQGPRRVDPPGASMNDERNITFANGYYPHPGKEIEDKNQNSFEDFFENISFVLFV